DKEGEQHDQRNGQQLSPAQVALDRFRDFVVCYRVAAEPDLRVVGERGEQPLPGLLLLRVVQRAERRDQVGRTAIPPDHGRVVGGAPVEDGDDRRIAAQFRFDGGDCLLRAGHGNRGLKAHESEDAVCRVNPGGPRDALACLGAAGSGHVEPPRLEVLADTAPQRHCDRSDHDDDREQPPRTAIDQVGKPGEHYGPAQAPCANSLSGSSPACPGAWVTPYNNPYSITANFPPTLLITSLCPDPSNDRPGARGSARQISGRSPAVSARAGTGLTLCRGEPICRRGRRVTPAGETRGLGGKPAPPPPGGSCCWARGRSPTPR